MAAAALCAALAAHGGGSAWAASPVAPATTAVASGIGAADSVANAPSAAWCSRGLRHRNLCCAASCEVCGGPQCVGLCCGSQLVRRGSCRRPSDTSCTLPPEAWGDPHFASSSPSASSSSDGQVGGRRFAPGFKERHSLFCFTLIDQRDSQAKLLMLQRRHGLGIFGCDEYQVFSNSSASVLFQALGGADIRVTKIFNNQSLQAAWRHNALNTGIFANVWKRVFQERRFERHDWVVKVDLDTVLVPEQLRQAIRRQCRTPCGAVHFRQNYTEGLAPWTRAHMRAVLFEGAAMFGGLQVMSRSAVLRFAEFFKVCKYELASGSNPEWWGDEWSLHEDVFVDRCLARIGVEALVERRLLQEGSLIPRAKPRSRRWPQPCPGGYAGYHPFKSSTSYLRCQSQAAMRFYQSKEADKRDSGLFACSTLGEARGFPPACPLPVARLRH
eukprot:TRINITY_DN14317_c0_g1_i1.p1 TRINITY_DN14317_c0_g1~~TRINITY_DN14317_c0_g1_i1.p1  ORF type:complete len:442 (+),score=87.53 TRINITY_DN14317_c0_g1_i1:94-1419(+)